MANILDRAQRLVYTSVDDCRSSLKNCGSEDIPVLRRALELIRSRPNQKTKRQLIERKLRKLEGAR